MAYQSVLDSKKESAELYFNIANCYYKLNNFCLYLPDAVGNSPRQSIYHPTSPRMNRI